MITSFCRGMLAWFACAAFALSQGSQLPKYTVATLPAASTQPHYIVQVIDGASSTDCATGGGAQNVACVNVAGVWYALGSVSPTFTGTVTITAAPTCAVLSTGSGGALTCSPTSYLPLNGGTLTGALNGTSATFSGTVAAGTAVVGTQTDVTCGGASDLSILQTALNSYLRVNVHGNKCVVSAALQMPSNSTLVVDQDTVIQPANGTNFAAGAIELLTNSTPTTGNSNIDVSGGIWDGNRTNITGCADGSGAFQWGCIGIMFKNVTNLRIHDFTIQNTYKFHVMVWGGINWVVENEKVADTAGNAYTDGIHVEGPSSHGRISNISVIGTTGDDTICLCADEPYPSSGGTMTSSGLILDTQITGVHGGSNAAQGVRLLSYSTALNNTTVSQIDGTFQNYVLTMDCYCGTYTAGNFAETVIKDINATYGAGWASGGVVGVAGVMIGEGATGNIFLSNLDLTAYTGATGHPLTNGANGNLVTSFSVFHLTKHNTTASGYVELGSPAPSNLFLLDVDSPAGYTDVFAQGGLLFSYPGSPQSVTVQPTTGSGVFNVVSGDNTSNIQLSAISSSGGVNLQTSSPGNITVYSTNSSTIAQAGTTSLTVHHNGTVESSAMFVLDTLIHGADATPVPSSCGTSPAIFGSTTHWTVTEGTGATACYLSFVGPTVPQHCTVTSEAGLLFSYFLAGGNTGIAITNIGALAGTKLDGICTE